ncbi:hypothetical protein [Amycolatopsis rubida]|uniref:Uncharacterized protein n=1 Tax=Amycolatopsis rubida TaxID=112413 RepID=A0A1I5X575_9PSEU|nr:hypothetical protein [Amycolatopsis rubida]SFQ27165.1 hypothetical protein SAMN05421854_11041 [Amycolatopsis rubida]
MTTISRREPTDDDDAQLREAVRALSWQHTLQLSGLREGEPPHSPLDESVLDSAGRQAAALAYLAALHDVRRTAGELITLAVAAAEDAGVAAPAIDQALSGVTGVAVRQRMDLLVHETRHLILEFRTWPVKAAPDGLIRDRAATMLAKLDELRIKPVMHPDATDSPMNSPESVVVRFECQLAKLYKLLRTATQADNYGDEVFICMDALVDIIDHAEFVQ